MTHHSLTYMGDEIQSKPIYCYYIQVRDMIRRPPGPSFEVYDYILATASLLSITSYVTYLLLRKRKLHLPDVMMICLLLLLFMAILCFILITVPVGRNRIGCEALAALVQYFFLASCLWGNAWAFKITKTLYSLSLDHVRLSSLKFYALYAMGCPLVFVLVGVVLSKFKITAFTHPVYREELICFLHEKITLYVTFLIPMYASIIVNVTLAIISIVRVVRSGDSIAVGKNRKRKNVITVIKLSLCLGVGWVFLFIATATGDAGWYLYMQIFVELQGVLVVLANLLGWNCLTSVKSWTQICFSTWLTPSTSTAPIASRSATGPAPSTTTSQMSSGL